MDFYELLDMYAFDVEKASEVARQRNDVEEVLKEVGLEKMEPESYVTICGRLCCTSGCPCLRY